MAKKFLVVLTTIMLLGIIVMPVKNVIASDSELLPDIVTDKVIFVSSDPGLILELKKGTLGIVSFLSGDYIGFDIQGGNGGTDLIVSLNHPVSVSLTNPVGLLFKKGKLEVYLCKSVSIVSIKWNYVISTFEIKHSWFPQYISAQIVKIEDTGAYESEKNYCCNPPIIHTSYFYKLYLTTNGDPYAPPSPKETDVIVGVMIPDYLVDVVKQLAINHDHIFIGIKDNQIYFWLSQ